MGAGAGPGFVGATCGGHIPTGISGGAHAPETRQIKGRVQFVFLWRLAIRPRISATESVSYAAVYRCLQATETSNLTAATAAAVVSATAAAAGPAAAGAAVAGAAVAGRHSPSKV